MAAPKGKLINIRSAATLDRPFRMVKMLQPICPEHYPQDGTQRPYSGWVKECQAAGHDPYITTREEEVVRPKYEKNAEGEKIKVGEETYVKLVETYNFEQVPQDIKAYSGIGVADAQAQGYIFPEDYKSEDVPNGFAPFCEFRNCWVQNPKFQTPVGIYCSRPQAAIMVLYKGGNERSTEGVPTYANAGDDANRLREQLARVNVAEGMSGHVH